MPKKVEKKTSTGCKETVQRNHSDIRNLVWWQQVKHTYLIRYNFLKSGVYRTFNVEAELFG